MKKINLIVPKTLALDLYYADEKVKEALAIFDKDLIRNAILNQKRIENEIESFLGKKLSTLDFFEIVDRVKENKKMLM